MNVTPGGPIAKAKAVQFGLVMGVMLGTAVVLTVWRTQEIREMFGL